MPTVPARRYEDLHPSAARDFILREARMGLGRSAACLGEKYDVQQNLGDVSSEELLLLRESKDRGW
jgi:hypothetical protein